MTVDDDLQAARRRLDELPARPLDLDALAHRSQTRRRGRLGLAAALVVLIAAATTLGVTSLVDRPDGTVDVVSDGGENQTPQTTSEAPTATSTSTSSTTTTPVVPVDELAFTDLAVRDVIELEVVYLPPGDAPDPAPDRIHYEDGPELWGPSHIATGPDGTRWIPDVPAGRIVRIAADGTALDPIHYRESGEVMGIQGILVTDDSVFVLDSVQSPPVIAELTREGDIVDIHPVPEEAWVRDGLPVTISSQLLSGDDGRPVLTTLGDRLGFLALDPRTGDFEPLDVFVSSGTTFGFQGYEVRIDGRRIDLSDDTRMAGGRLAGITSSGEAVLTVTGTATAEDGSTRLTQWVHRHPADASDPVARYEFDLSSHHLPVSFPTAVGPDGLIHVLEAFENQVRVTTLE
ncbi:MAG: hypothetical protein ACLFRV_11225 [Acidimicrobiales bacterium]